MKRFDYYKAALCTPPVHIGSPEANAVEIIRMARSLDSDTQLCVFPELCITGYTCADLFYEERLLTEARIQLVRIAREIPQNLAAVVGVPLAIWDRLYNCAAFLYGGRILGIYVKTHLPGYNEYYEPRWFSSARDLDTDMVTIESQEVPVSDKILFEDRTTGACIGLEICEDLWVAIPPSSHHAQAGANILVNCSASNEVIAKNRNRTALVTDQSARTQSAYLYCSAGPQESSTDLVFSGADIAAEQGHILGRTQLFDSDSILVAEIDLGHLKADRLRFKTALSGKETGYKIISYASQPLDTIVLTRPVKAYPFVPDSRARRLERCQQILDIQVQGLATRLQKIHCKKAVVGISGGLDSTLALLVTVKAFDKLHLDRKGIIAITMPGFGTTSRTKTNADELMELLGVTRQEISISAAVRQHFADIGQDESVHDITYENSQARMRTMILMDEANKENGIVIGTGDLSELALGWCTYNGDHMSMYAVNASVPKTLVRYLVESESIKAEQEHDKKLAEVLQDICDTPVSPELLPPDTSGQIQQKTEEVLGSYDLHDFFLYHMLRYHESPAKIYALAQAAFDNVDPKVIKTALLTFYQRFFAQQFKRSCLPDGPKVGSICLSPRGDWRMPSDSDRTLWIKEAESL